MNRVVFIQMYREYKHENWSIIVEKKDNLWCIDSIRTKKITEYNETHQFLGERRWFCDATMLIKYQTTRCHQIAYFLLAYQGLRAKTWLPSKRHREQGHYEYYYVKFIHVCHHQGKASRKLAKQNRPLIGLKSYWSFQTAKKTSPTK